MVNQKQFVNQLLNMGVTFFCGVPDSYLNGFNNYLKNNIPAENNIITANEGNAVALASGYYFATGRIPLVYMQNSGLGNCVNPLLSLADAHVYSVPMILLIGWRGQPGTKDGDREQHTMQGRLTLPLLKDMEIPYRILSDENAMEDVAWASEAASLDKHPVALISPDGVLTEKKKNSPDGMYPMSREEAISLLLDLMPENAIYAATTGRATRELFCQREIRGQTHAQDFLNIGSMGHCSSVAMGLALANPKRKVVCLDGDAAAIMHMGAMTTVSKVELPNFIHVVLNNGEHESVGGQPSAGYRIDLSKIAEGCGYYTVGRAVEDMVQLETAVKQCLECGVASFMDVRIHSGIRSGLHSITMSSREMIDEFMEELRR